MWYIRRSAAVRSLNLHINPKMLALIPQTIHDVLHTNF